MPIVPCDLIDKVEAPVPMLAGITDREFEGPLLQSMSEEEYGFKTWIFLNKDQQGIKRIDWSHLDDKLPSICFKDLRNRLKPDWLQLQNFYS